MWIGAGGQITDIQGEMLSGGCISPDLVALTKIKVVIERPPISVDGIGSQAEIPLNLKPSSGVLVLCNKWVMFPPDICHWSTPSIRTAVQTFPPSADLRIPRLSAVSRPSPAGAPLRCAALTQPRLRGPRCFRWWKKEKTWLFVSLLY